MRYLLFCVAILMCVSIRVTAQPGVLDSSFGDDGKVITPIIQGRVTAALQTDGKILCAGSVIVRYLVNGAIDSSFGNNGIVQVNIPGFNGTIIAGITEFPDKKILATGVAIPADVFDHDILLIRLLPNGLLDTSFGGTGYINTSFGFFEDAIAMVIQQDGKVVVTGSVVTDIQQNSSHVFVARFNPDGSKDKAFGNSGWTYLQTHDYTYGTTIALQKDGRMVVGSINKASNRFMLLRFNADGTPDNSFGVAGIVNADLPGDNQNQREYVSSIALQEDGKIVAAGISKLNSLGAFGKMTVARYNSDGTFDETFAASGVSVVKFATNNSEARSVAIQKDGKILLSGRNFNDNREDQPSDFALARLSTNGLLDSSFGINGMQITDFGGYDVSDNTLLQKDGKIVCVGTGTEENYFSFARYYGDPINPHPLITKIKRWIRNHILNFESTGNGDIGYYVIEKQTGSGAFKEVATIPTNSANNYQFDLNKAGLSAGNNVYRIKGVLKDGGVVYSDIITDVIAAPFFTIFPNPAKDKFNIQSSKAVTLRLQNSNGDVLLTQKVNGSGIMDISKLRSGVYYLVDVESGVRVGVVKE